MKSKKEKEADRIFFAINFILSVVSLGLLISILMQSCDISSSDWGNPPNPVDTTIITPIDTTGIPHDTTQPLTIPCASYAHLSDTNFVCLSAAFDLPLSMPTYHYYLDGNNVYMDLATIFSAYYPANYQYTYYQSSKAITVFVDGTNNTIQFSGKISVRSNNPSTSLTAYKNGFYTFGALTFDEEVHEADHRLNCESFDNRGMNFTQEQTDIINRKRMHFEFCKHGERRADFRYSPTSQSVIDSAQIYLWQNVLQ